MTRGLAALVWVLALSSSWRGVAGRRYHGDGTAYSGDYSKDDTGFNSCQFGRLDDTWEKYYAALSSRVFDRAGHCGRCVRVRGTEGDAPGRWVTAMIVDECASCAADDIDLSTRALKASTGYSWDRKRVEWEFTACGSENDNRNDDRDRGDGDEHERGEEKNKCD